MCDNNDMEGVRLWFYGGTPPLDEACLEDQDLHAPPRPGWAWDEQAAIRDDPIDRPPDLAAA